MLLKDLCFSKLSEIIIIILVYLKILGYIRFLLEIYYYLKMFINYFRIFFDFFFVKVLVWVVFVIKIVNNFMYLLFF